MSSNRQYGLQLTKKNSHGLVQKHAAFGDDSDSEKSDGENTDWAKRAFKASEKNTVKRQTKIEMLRALDDDATVYQYDEIYEQIQKGKQDLKQKDKEKKPKYIQKLIVAAEKRKIENERRIERQVQKEREAEGEEFKDKETFVTAAYKKKLEEFAKLDEEQKRYDMLEEIGDVTKQQDMGGFYRHLYQTKINGPSPSDDSPSKASLKDENESSKKDSISLRRSQSKSGSASKETSPTKFFKEGKQTRITKESENSSEKTENKKDNRQYRKRKYSESSTDKNKDADTGGSSSSSSSSSDSESGEEKSSQSETEDPKRIRSKEDHLSNAQPALVENIIEEEPEASDFPVEPERSIWEKRTVGPVFDAALKRYFERKCARVAIVS